MQKVFLSHSSLDKESYVKIVSNKLIKDLGKESIILDEISFQEGRKTIEEIEEMLEYTDLFVFFCSEASLSSTWVQKELFRAEELWSDDKLLRICPIIISNSIKYDDERIPKWMQTNYNIQYVSRPNKAAQIIQQRMIELSFERHPRLKERNAIFVGRNEQINAFEERMDDFEQSKPFCVVASGLNSVGRKTLLKKCVIKSNIKKESYPFSYITLNYDESIEDFILKMYDLGLTEEMDLKNMIRQTIEEKVSIAVSILRKIQEQNEILIVEDNGAIINHDGELSEWFVKVLGEEEIKCKLTLCIVAKFRLKYIGDILDYKIKEKIFYFGVEELSKKERKGLLSRYLEFENLELCTEDKKLILGLLSGFPEQVFYSVTLIKEKGLDYVKKNTFEIVEYNSKKTSVVIKEIEQDEEKLSFLALLSSFDYISIKYVFDIIEREHRYVKYLEEFLSKSICEYVGLLKEYIRVNDTIKDYVVRNRYSINSKHQSNIKKSVDIFLKNLTNNEYDIPEYLFSLKEILSSGKPIDSKYLVPSLYLKTMTDFYNMGKNKDVVLFADKALENEEFMDSRIVFEIRYLLCSALAKQRDGRFKKEVYKISGADYYFLYGFYYRQIGQYDRALDMINKSMKNRPNFSKAKREKVQIYLGMQEFQTAKELAKENYENYQDNPYHIQAYFSCLIKSEKNSENKEILLTLISSLNSINTDVSKEMTLRCKAQFEAIYNDNLEQALFFINQAIEMNSSKQYARIVKFDICDRFDLLDEMKEILAFFKQPEYRNRYQMNIVCFQSIIIAKEKNVNEAIDYFNNNIKYFTDEAKQKFIAKLNRYNNTAI